MQGLKNAWKYRNAYDGTRLFCTKVRPIPMELYPDINSDLEKEVYKPRFHPGINKPRCITVPKYIVEAIAKCFNDYPLKLLHEDGQRHSNYLKARHAPIEPAESRHKNKATKRELLEELGIPSLGLQHLDIDTAQRVRQHVKYEVERRVKTKKYNWIPIDYNDHQALVYLAGRSAQEYAVIYKIFLEISKRNPEFKPSSFFDFGSGIGTGTWAAYELWKKSIYEYFMVDVSADMNDLADKILRNGDVNKHRMLKNVYFRQFLPASNNAKYDIVLSAYSLFELENQKKRLETLLTLWNKCNGYLVLIEHGTNAGFKLINEARDFLLNATQKNRSAHVFAPCPHDDVCPRFTLNDGTPCNFETAYTPLNICESEPMGRELYSYVVLKKGPRPDNVPETKWPRIVRPTMVRTEHAICKLCTDQGKLENVIFSKGKHSKYTYRCGKSSDWGDRIPIFFKDDDGNVIGQSSRNDDDESKKNISEE